MLPGSNRPPLCLALSEPPVRTPVLCKGRVIRGYAPGQRVSIRYDMSEQQLLMRKGSELIRLCSTADVAQPDFYGKLMLYRQGTAIGGLRVVTAATAAAKPPKEEESRRRAPRRASTAAAVES